MEQARLFLEQTVAQIPRQWTSIAKEKGRDVIHAWTSDEFVAFRDFRERAGDFDPIAWLGGSYSHGYYLLAWMANERHDHRAALELLEVALRFEPDHPDVLCLKAFFLRQMDCVEDAVATYRQALTMRPWATKTQQARAWRGLGGCLIDLERMDEAEAALQQSLSFAPDSPMACSELDFIRGGRRKSSALPMDS
ncbi:MAG TPA: tetratricopeptide repeat protein [Bryobacteraceae bacterium]|nr:tetratricopeptide repeat protein [Bryobacteraceae bacterium]